VEKRLGGRKKGGPGEKKRPLVKKTSSKEKRPRGGGGGGKGEVFSTERVKKEVLPLPLGEGRDEPGAQVASEKRGKRE